MDRIIYIGQENVKTINNEEFSSDISEYFSNIPDLGYPLIKSAKATLSSIEKMLYSAPNFVNLIKSSVPKETFQAVLTDEQNRKLAEGSLKLMTRKDGSLMANLVNPKTKKIVSTISLEKTNITPDISQAMTNYATQMQIAQIAEQIQLIQISVEEVRKGQEYDRLASAYSCKQKLLQAMVIKNQKLKELALMRIANDSEDSRNLLMLSQNVSLDFIKNQPESFWGKILPASSPDKMDDRIKEIRENLYAVNMVSFVEAMAYFEMGEAEAAQQSLQYYAEYIQKIYLDIEGLVQRLDMLDPSPENYWSKALPDIKKRIMELPFNVEQKILEGEKYGDE
ncbi:MAG: hypothetical protein GX666_06935 [Tissierellia bacterium]|nr:hypothetical protein [Tissierellia bacterium]